MFDAPASLQPSENIDLLIAQFGRNDDCDRLPYGFFRRISEDVLRRGVPR
jgi:hypothetical protein